MCVCVHTHETVRQVLQREPEVMENMQLVYTASLNNEKLRKQVRRRAHTGETLEKEEKKEKDEKKEKRVSQQEKVK